MSSASLKKVFWAPPPCHLLSCIPSLSCHFPKMISSGLEMRRYFMWNLSPIFSKMGIFSTQNVLSRWTTTSNCQWNWNTRHIKQSKYDIWNNNFLKASWLYATLCHLFGRPYPPRRVTYFEWSLCHILSNMHC